MTWYLPGLALVVVLLAFLFRFLEKERSKKPRAYDLRLYAKKHYLFDTASEFHFFKLASTIVGPKYLVFPQINYGHLIISKARSEFEDRRYRNHLDRKSADFVVCDADTCIPRLVINIDGSIHSLPQIKERDTVIDEILRSVELPSVRISNEDSGKFEFVKELLSAHLQLGS